MYALLPQVATDPVAEIWKYHPHPEVWVLMVCLISAYVYMVRVIEIGRAHV